MALLPGSPAIDAGNNSNAPAYDQRGPGFARVVGSAIDIGAFEVQPATQVTHLGVSGPASAVAGTPFTVTVQALNDLGDPVPGYTGTIHFTSSDGRAVLPADYTFTATDAGTHTFSVTLKTAGTQSVTAADTMTSSLTATLTGVAVSAAAASILIINGPSGVTLGTAFTITVTIMDAYGNLATSYAGTIHFSSSDTKAGLPANYAFTTADKGVHTFSGVVLRTNGKQTITAIDMLFSTLTGSLTVNVS
jgi:hypothetical protein